MQAPSERSQATMYLTSQPNAWPDLINQLCRQFTAVATQLEQGWQHDLYNAHQELNDERRTSEELMHKVISMEEGCHGHQMSEIMLQQEQEKNGKLEKELQETKIYWNNAEHIVKDVGGGIDELQGKLAEGSGEAIAVDESLSIREILTELGRCKALLEVRDSQNGPNEYFEDFKALSDHNVASQRQIQELLRRNEELSKQAESGNAEIVNLNKILEIYAEDGSPRRRKRSRRNAA